MHLVGLKLSETEFMKMPLRTRAKYLNYCKAYDDQLKDKLK